MRGTESIGAPYAHKDDDVVHAPELLVVRPVSKLGV
jgi:hypothetical protein